MARTRYGQALRHVRTLFGVGTVGGLTDGQLLERFLADDAEVAELAFAALVERHGPMVLRVCRVVLGNEHDARDAFQAAFLILIHKAGTLRVHDSLGPWLHQVALRVARCARSAAARRRRHEQHAAEIAVGKRSDFGERDDLSLILHEEIYRLPERYRRPIVLCCLEGLSREEAAGQLGWPLGTVQSRLARGRERLRASLTRRGLAPSAALTAAVLSAEVARAAVPTEIVDPLVRAAARLAEGGSSMAEVISTGVISLTEGVLKTMLLTHVKLAATAVLAIGLATTGAGVWASQKSTPPRDSAPGGGAVEGHASGRERPCSVNPKGNCISCHMPNVEDPSRRSDLKDQAVSRLEPQHARKAVATPEVVARVNGKPITRQQLAERCLAKYGSKELETVIAMVLLEEACQRRGITVTDAEIDAEAAREAQSVGVSISELFQTLAEQKGMSKYSYLRDVVSVNLKLQKLGVDRRSFSGLEGFKQAMQKLEGHADFEVFLGQPLDRRDPGIKMPSQTQEDRLKAVERSLEQILKTLDGLKRPAEDTRR
jgi:RNA polymerase sigma factor (sigma-70 family)